MNILLDYFFPITSIEPTPQASTAFLKQACIVVKPKDGVDPGELNLCVSNEQVAALTDNTEAAQLFIGGMNRVYVLTADDLDIAAFLEGHESDFFTLLISSDFSQSDIENLVDTAEVKSSAKIQDILYESKLDGTAGDDITVIYVDDGEAGSETVEVSTHAITVHMEDGASTAQDIADAIEGETASNALVTVTVDEGDEDDIQYEFTPAVTLADGVDEVIGDAGAGLLVGQFKGVVGVSGTDDSFMSAQAAIEKRCAFHTTAGNKAKNMFFAFGKMLSNALNWRNQQYITMNFADDVDTLGEANAYFDDKVSFVISDSEFSNRLALFACGGKAIVGPYIKRNLELDMQSAALSYISGNQPSYSKKQAALLEDELQKVVKSYIEREWIEAGVVEVKLEQDNFVASGYINIAEPKALWRIFGEMRQTL
jgi:hypothetical protein